MDSTTWLSREMILAYIAIIGALYKAGKEVYSRIKAEARSQILAEQSVSTTEAKNREVQREREARERAEQIAENLRHDLNQCQAEKMRLWAMMGGRGDASS